MDWFILLQYLAYSLFEQTGYIPLMLQPFYPSL